MKLVPFLLIHICARTASSCVPPVVTTEYNFIFNVTQISGSLGSYIRVLCSAEPVEDVVSYVWQKNGVNLEEPSLFALYLTIRDLAVEDGGQYRCKVKTVNCGSRYSPEISINTPPGNVLISGPTSVKEGEPFVLTCSANGWPVPSYEWSFNEAVGIATGSDYSVSSATLSDSGDYTCIAQNNRGQTQQSFTLTVTTEVMASKTSSSTLSSQVTVSTSEELPKTLKPIISRSSVFNTNKAVTRTAVSKTASSRTKVIVPTPSTKGGDTRRVSESDEPAAFFVVLLALSIALLVALVCVIIIIFIFVVYMLRTPSRKNDDRARLLEEEPVDRDGDGIEMREGIIRGENSGQKSSTEKSPVSFVNIAFGRDGIDDDDEEEEEKDKEETGEGAVVVRNNNGVHDTSILKVSPQRYQQQQGTKALSPSKRQSQPLSSCGLPHTVSMDVPNDKQRNRVPHSRSAGEPGQLNSTHLMPPVDKHKVGRRKKKTNTKEKLCREKDKVQLLTAMEESEDQSNVTSNKTVSMDDEPGEERERREEKKSGEAKSRETERNEALVPITYLDDDDEIVSSGAVGQNEGLSEVMERNENSDRLDEAKEKTETSFIGEVEGEEMRENVNTETNIVVQEKIGEASITFEEEGNTSDLLGEDSVAVLSSGEGGGGGESRVMIEEKGNVSGSLKEEGRDGFVEGGGVGSEAMMEKEGEESEVSGVVEVGKEGRQEEVITKSVSVSEKVILKKRDKPSTAESNEMMNDQDPDIHRMSVFVEKATKMGRSISSIAQLDRSHPLNLMEIEGLVDEAMAGQNTDTLTIEYKTVPHNSVHTLPLSTEEKHKNRYRNVLPNPHSVVRLSDTGMAGSQYINANYIRGYGGKEKQYIATQGPTTHTVPDFWRMIWEKEVSIIVMTTPLVERGTQKCVKYWPTADDIDTAIYGNIVVRNNYEEVTEFYTTSYLSIYQQSSDGQEIGEERDVYHFWYTAWTDFSVPKETRSILKLQEAVDAFRIPTSGPLVVHCSAGLGRSGTFMAIDMGIQQYVTEGNVDPLKYMCEMRQDRGGIIQTVDQYIYIHRALKDYITG